MFPLPQVEGKTYAVFGLGRTGLSAARALHQSGAKVIAWDDNAETCVRANAQLDIAPSDTETWDWSTIEALVLSPGVPLTHPVPHPIVAKANAEGVSIIGDMELFVQSLEGMSDHKAPIIAVTGTNGKSTTTSLIGHILARSGFLPQMGGNIGTPVLDLDAPSPKRVYVLEVSSYQLDLTPSLAPDVAVLLNIRPDHLNRHGGMDGYIASKMKIFDHQQADDTAIIGIDDEASSSILTDLKRKQMEESGAKVVPLTVGKSLGRGVFVLDGRIVDATQDPASRIMDISDLISMRGKHNWQNAAAAYAACHAIGAEPGRIVDAIERFPGLAHRQEFLAQAGKVAFINDSKATNGEAALMALTAYHNIFWIVGGEAKEGGLAATEPAFDHVRMAYLIGQAAQEFAGFLEGKLDYVIAGTMEEAVRMANADAAACEALAATVLLSPACASFDQYKDFEARGEAFRTLVLDLVPQDAAEGVMQ